MRLSLERSEPMPLNPKTVIGAQSNLKKLVSVLRRVIRIGIEQVVACQNSGEIDIGARAWKARSRPLSERYEAPRHAVGRRLRSANRKS